MNSAHKTAPDPKFWCFIHSNNPQVPNRLDYFPLHFLTTAAHLSGGEVRLVLAASGASSAGGGGGCSRGFHESPAGSSVFGKH